MSSRRLAATVAAAVSVIGTAFASVAYADTPNWGFEALVYASFPTPTDTAPFATPAYVNPLLTREAAVLTRQGISPARASHAINIQNELAQGNLIRELENAMATQYAGVWFDPNTAQLHIGVTSPASRRTAEEVVARTGLVSAVTETQVRSTRAQLILAQKRWNRRLAKLFTRGEVETALLPQRNAVSIALSSSMTPSERVTIEREALTANVNVIVTVIPSSRLHFTTASNTTECTGFTEHVARCNKPITAGVSIVAHVGTELNFCTAGPLALPKAAANRSETYLLTAGHCIESAGGNGVKWLAYNRALPVPEAKELGAAAKFIFGAEGDIGAIKVNNPGEWAVAGNPALYAVMAKWGLVGEPIKSVPVSEERLPMVGRATCREGEVSGEACGKIKAEGLTIPVEGKTITGLIEWERAAGQPEVQLGDSGGPFFSAAVVGVAEEGTLVANSGANFAAYEPLGTAFAELNAKGLNLELLTTSNEGRCPP